MVRRDWEAMHLWMISTPDLLEICDIPETGRTSLDLDRDRLGTGGTGGSRCNVDDISPALITEWCTAVPPCHCTAAGQETTLACGLMRSKARTESFLIPGLSLVFYMSLMQSKGIWLQFHAGDAMSTKTRFVHLKQKIFTKYPFLYLPWQTFPAGVPVSGQLETENLWQFKRRKPLRDPWR